MIALVTMCCSPLFAEAKKNAKDYCSEIENIAASSRQPPQAILWEASEEIKKLSELNSDAALYVIEELKKENKNWKYKYVLLQYLRLENEKRAVPTIIKITTNSNEPAKLRAAACATLGELRDKSAVPALKDSLKDKDREVKRGAAVALGTIGDKSAYKDLIDAFEIEDNNTVKVDLLRGLAGVKHKKSIKFIASTLLNKDEDQVVRGMAAIVLGKIGGGEAVKTLKIVLNENNSLISINAIGGLGHTKSDKAIGVLEKCLENSDLAPVALGALTRIGNEKAFQVIKDVANSSQDEMLRESAKTIVAEWAQSK